MSAILGALAIDQWTCGRRALAKPATLDARSTVFRAVNGRPDESLVKVIELMGGIEKIIGPDDIVIVKPNVQWWNQGAANLSAVAAFVGLVMARPGGFEGEVVLAENCHRGASPWEAVRSGWAPRFERNSDLQGVNNYNELSAYLKAKYGERVSTVHWVNVDAGTRRVYGPADGVGYVYCDGTGGVPLVDLDNGRTGESRRSVIMTYPVFRTDRGTVVDFKHGVWEEGAYTDRPVKFVNFAALNHHSTYCGATSAVKNYLGVVDLSGGPDPHDRGKLTEEYYNFHSFPYDKWAPGPSPGMLGAEVGVFMNTVRRADLNITTAEWVGLASRTDAPVARTRAVLASPDPVALDYHAFKYLLHSNSGIRVHDPDEAGSPVRQELAGCAEHGGGVLDERHVEVRSWDLRTGKLQGDRDLAVSGRKHWGTNAKAIMKYLYLRYRT